MWQKKNLKKLTPLEVTCSSSDCDNNLHCFTQNIKKLTPDDDGKCKYCGAELIDPNRIRRRDLSDIQYTFDSLKHELWRHHYWHIDIDIRAVNHAHRKGKKGMREAAEHRLEKYIGTANPLYDGRQTPKTGNIIYYAQHATACCCRKCIEFWHGIPMGQALTKDQLKYFTDLVMLYIDERMPTLPEDGEYVPNLQ
ncbi:MAG: DUF4186 family protein [Desulforudis sp.]|nr:MAG: DUF4186 family protein [Desulforudis sp.]